MRENNVMNELHKLTGNTSNIEMNDKNKVYSLIRILKIMIQTLR